MAHKFPSDEENIEEVQESETINTDQALAKAIDFMNSKENIDIKSDIPNSAIPFVVALSQEEKYTESKVMSTFIKEFKILRVSKDRKSREEIIELAKTRREPEFQNTGFLQRASQWLRGGGSNY